MRKGIHEIQEEMSDCRGNRTAFTCLTVGGILFAGFPLFINLFILVLAILSDRPNPGSAGMEHLVWSLPVGIVIVISGIAGVVYYDHKVKKLARKLDLQEQIKKERE